jgi:sugar-specific transcriptional regulator TrmB
MRQELNNFFTNLGLSETEAILYLAALELGQAHMQDLAKKSGLKRTSIYNYLEALLSKGLITSSKKKRRIVYIATNPEQLIEIEKARLAELERTVPELSAIYNNSKNKPKITFFEGVNGIKNIYADSLKERQPIFGWSDFENMAEVLGDYYFDIYPPERAKRGIVIKTFVPDGAKSKEFQKNDAKYLRETKLVKFSDWKTEIYIYGNKVALMSFRSNPPIAILIEDKDITQTLKFIWEQLWNKS